MLTWVPISIILRFFEVIELENLVPSTPPIIPADPIMPKICRLKFPCTMCAKTPHTPSTAVNARAVPTTTFGSSLNALRSDDSVMLIIITPNRPAIVPTTKLRKNSFVYFLSTTFNECEVLIDVTSLFLLRIMRKMPHSSENITIIMTVKPGSRTVKYAPITHPTMATTVRI